MGLTLVVADPGMLVATLYAYAADDATGCIASDALRLVDADWYARRFGFDPETVRTVQRELLAADDGVVDTSPVGSLLRWARGYRLSMIGFGILITDPTGRVCWFNAKALPPRRFTAAEEV